MLILYILLGALYHVHRGCLCFPAVYQTYWCPISIGVVLRRLLVQSVRLHCHRFLAERLTFLWNVCIYQLAWERVERETDHCTGWTCGWVVFLFPYPSYAHGQSDGSLCSNGFEFVPVTPPLPPLPPPPLFPSLHGGLTEDHVTQMAFMQSANLVPLVKWEVLFGALYSVPLTAHQLVTKNRNFKLPFLHSMDGNIFLISFM